MTGNVYGACSPDTFTRRERSRLGHSWWGTARRVVLALGYDSGAVRFTRYRACVRRGSMRSLFRGNAESSA